MRSPAAAWRSSSTATEFELLRYLMRNPRRVLSKAQILDRVWNYDFGGQANVVELYISYLRKKIDANRAPMIHTMRGAGLRAPPAAEPALRLTMRLAVRRPRRSAAAPSAASCCCESSPWSPPAAILLSLLTTLAVRQLLVGQVDQQLDSGGRPDSP